MRVTPPVPITPLKLISSSATALHNPAAYASGTTYAFGAIVQVAADYAIYESLQAGNLGNTPSSNPLWWRKIGVTETAWASGTTYALAATCSYNYRCYESLQVSNTGHTPPIYPETETDWWIDVGPVNRMAMFDLDRNTQTVWPSPLTVVFAPGQRVNTIGIGGMEASQVQISATSVTGGGAVWPNAYSESATGIFDLNTREVMDGWDYCFEPFSTRPSQVVFDLPPYSDIIITVTISSTTGNVKCGSIVVGNYIYIGDLQQNVAVDSLNFSTVDRDIYGSSNLIKRRQVPKIDVKLVANVAFLNKIMAAKKLLDAEPALWTGLDDPASPWFEAVQLLGVWKEFSFGDSGMIDRVEITLKAEEI